MIVKYGKAQTFKTEGDMYEAIVGRRSTVLDSPTFYPVSIGKMLKGSKPKKLILK